MSGVTCIGTSWALAVTLLAAILVPVAVPRAEAARAFFVFGDSLVDNGNNNYLATTARAGNTRPKVSDTIPWQQPSRKQPMRANPTTNSSAGV